ncbi:hypothetical protein [Lysobacter sp. ESA13C]|uniref:hypothetical protein n=1 Tax=Lysobacter sp. ESA13C TaxID=2862676 RepID=UPI001CC184E9|nr:hypothetical protein [Lysobacter sp. ESA13C]
MTSPSDTDRNNQREGSEITFGRTWRLLYVCCSRAGKDLAVFFFADNQVAAHATIVDPGLFPAEDVHNLATV